MPPQQATSLSTRVRTGEPVTDEDFDQLYPSWVRRASDLHWTPYVVARRAAELLVVDSTTRVLDVGSGAGKFCVVGSLATEGLFFGVEQRSGLVEVAQETARRCGAIRTHFIHANATALDWGAFDAFYLYNPFYEHIASSLPSIEEPIECSPELYSLYTLTTSAKLFSARVGTRVVTYQGYGAAMPAGYRRLACESFDGHELELWRKEPLLAMLEKPKDEERAAEQTAESALRRG